MQFNNPTSTRKTKYDNSTLKKINRPVALAACSPSHPAGDRRDVRSGGRGGADSRCRGWRFLHVRTGNLSTSTQTAQWINTYFAAGLVGSEIFHVGNVETPNDPATYAYTWLKTGTPVPVETGRTRCWSTLASRR